MSQPAPTIDRLLHLAADDPSAVLAHLATHPELASKQDIHGYSLLHAAASYAHTELLEALVKTCHVDANIRDEDGETALFSVEDVDMARALLELGTDPSLTNHEGLTAEDKLADEDEQPEVALWLRQRREGRAEGAVEGEHEAEAQRLPPLPNGVTVNVGTMGPDEAGAEPDPEFRRRIEELAARADFEGVDGQKELRALVEEAVTGLGGEGQGTGSRRRVD